MFGEKLKQLRKEQQLTQEQLADKIDVARTTYSSYEQGRREPDNETLTRIANFFGVTTDFLLGRNKAPKWASDDQIIELDKILQSKAGMAYNDGEITDEDREAIDNMIAGYFWNKKNKEDNRR